MFYFIKSSTLKIQRFGDSIIINRLRLCIVAILSSIYQPEKLQPPERVKILEKHGHDKA
jgi:hypothetical protein